MEFGRTTDILSVLSILILISLCKSSTQETKAFSFASYYGDHMVLQKAPQRAQIWGYALVPGETVTLMANDQKYLGMTQTVPGPVPFQPIWSLLLPPMEAGGPHRISAYTNEGGINISDVLFGDIWICSGQSNMQFTLDMAFNASEELADAVNYPNLRVFTVGLKGAPTLQYDLISIPEHWAVPSNETIGHSPWSYFSAVCWLYGKYLSSVLKYPIGLLATSFGGTRIEAWSSPRAMDQCPNKTENTHYRPSTVTHETLHGAHSSLWNAMLHPLVNMTIYGVIWYQGEANSHPGTGTDVYSCRFPAMIDDWRLTFNEGTRNQTASLFPFGFVQLAPWRNNASQTDGFPEIRWHQTADYGYVPNDRMQNVFMAVAMDLPDFTSPYRGSHPRDKQDVAQRLHTEGLAVGYNMTQYVKLRGPFPTAINIRSESDKSVTITYDNRQTPLDIRTSDGFEVCCIQTPTRKLTTYCDLTTDVWKHVNITQHDTATVTLSYGAACNTKEKPSIGAIRYAWKESPCGFKKCAVYNKISGYPAPPFVRYVV